MEEQKACYQGVKMFLFLGFGVQKWSRTPLGVIWGKTNIFEKIAFSKSFLAHFVGKMAILGCEMGSKVCF